MKKKPNTKPTSSQAKKLFVTSWRYIRRSPYQSLAAIGVMTLTFFITAVFILTAAGSAKILDFFEKRPQVIAFLEDKVTPEQVNSLTESLIATGKVEAVKYVSKEEALKIYQEQNKDDPLLLEMVSAEILPASLEVSTRQITDLTAIAEFLDQQAGIEEVSFQKDVVEILQKVTRGIRKIGLILISFLMMVSFLVILVITSMKAALRRREIKIVQLLGASPWYIRAPFLFEGVFYGLIGAFLAWCTAYLCLLYATPFLISFLSGLPLLPVSFSFMFLLLLSLMAIGVFIGGLGSLLAVRRYLR